MAEGSLSCSDFENNLGLSDKTDKEQAGVPAPWFPTEAFCTWPSAEWPFTETLLEMGGEGNGTCVSVA